MKGYTEFLLGLTTFFFILNLSLAIDTISVNQTIRHGETIVSANGDFELGFFRPSNSSQNRFLGIWFKKISTGNDAVVWVANRETPLTDTSGILRVHGDGILQLFNSSNRIIWSSNSSISVSKPVAQLLDTGNFVIRDETASAVPDSFIWQSFDYPGDTILSGMKFGKNLVTGMEWYQVAWRSKDDPSPGEYKIYFNTNGYPQTFETKGSEVIYRLGGWNGLRWTGLPGLKPSPFYRYHFVFNQDEFYYQWESTNSSVITKTRLTPEGDIKRFNWDGNSNDWFMYATTSTDGCAHYGFCGPYGSCNINNSPDCGCFRGFEPKNQQQWNRTNWSSGCVRQISLDCGKGEGFRKYSDVKLPDTSSSWYNQNTTLAECKKICKNNCLCTAYANMDIRGRGSGCLLWFGDLIDIRKFPEDGQDIYIRMAASELAKDRISRSKIRVLVIVVSVLLLLTIGVSVCLWHVFKMRKLKRKVLSRNSGDDEEEYNNETQNKSMELPLLSLSTLNKATNNFSIDHKLGEGGFGPVYKGKLSTGQDIAVKRLSENSWQGLKEFKNEILLISNLQHRNLVKIVGCCLEGNERLLAYEYLPNKSLDNFIFDEKKKLLLTWQHRVAIATGIAKGLLYLHDDSRLRIIHRDLKASNVLLDSDLKPKISDFGIARIVAGDQIEGRTKRIIGTHGYMSPEYATYGKFSVKSDIYSFGVLLIELVSGKKITKYCHPDHHHSLSGHAWLLWKEGNALELLDACLEDSYVESEVLKIIQVGLLCIQNFPKDRPTMSVVVLMLSNEGATLPQPKEPGFFMQSNSSEDHESFDNECSLSECVQTITKMEAR